MIKKLKKVYTFLMKLLQWIFLNKSKKLKENVKKRIK